MRLARWLWTRQTVPARLGRAALAVPAAAFKTVAAARAAAFRAGIFRRRVLSVPTISVGNLTVGGTGKTPMTGWIANRLVAAGRRPGIVLRGYGADEGQVHRLAAPQAIVREHGNRRRAAEAAIAAGADVVVLDDGFQRLDLARDLDIALVSAESLQASRWTLPAGPWREGMPALVRADFVIVSRRFVSLRAAHHALSQITPAAPAASAGIIRLGISGFCGLHSGVPYSRESIAGASLVVACGIADPLSFEAQCRSLGARARLIAWPDHHPYRPRDVHRLLREAQAADYVVITEKDAVKLRRLWPPDEPEPLVAGLEISWEQGLPEFERCLELAVTRSSHPFTPNGERQLVDASL